MLFQPCRFCSLLVTLKMSFSVSMNEINDEIMMMVTKSALNPVQHLQPFTKTT